MSTLLKTINSGYIGTPEKWIFYFKQFFKDFNCHNVNIDDVVNIDKNNINKKIHELKEIENKLKINLPKSYKDFYLSGGFEIFDYIISKTLNSYEKILFDINAIGRFKELSEQMFFDSVYDEETESKIDDYLYYQYDSYNKDLFTASGGFKLSCLNFIQFGIRYDAPDGIDVLGIVDSEVTADGENEVWVLTLGREVYRYRSFAEFFILMLMLDVRDYNPNENSFNIINYPSTAIILDIEILKTQWKPV